MATTQHRMLMNASGLVVNAYRDTAGRGDYFPGSAGTTEGQFLFIKGALDAYRAIGSGVARGLARLALSEVLKVIYRNRVIPSTVSERDIFAPHWLFNVKYPFTAAEVHLDRQYPFVNGVATVPIADGAVRYLFNVRSLDSEFLWENPYSLLRTGQFYDIAERVATETGTTITLEDDYTGNLYVTYSTLTGETIETDQVFEAWPDWRPLDEGEISCAVDTFIWAWRAFDIAYGVLGDSTWDVARTATAQQAAIAMDVNDSRDWLKLTSADTVFDKGAIFFSPSSLEDVQPPTFYVDADGNRVIDIPRYQGSSGKDSNTTWWDRTFGLATMQFGVADVGDTFGEDDVLEIDISITTYAPGETTASEKIVALTAFVDLYQTYSAADRYTVILTSRTNLGDTSQYRYALDRGAWINSNAEVLPAGSPIYTFGLIFGYNNGSTGKIVLGRVGMRKPKDLAYYPGLIPFTANFQGNPPMLIDWRGPVYMGYQAPAMWIHANGSTEAAMNCAQLLADSQAEYANTIGGNGPFVPVFYFDRDDAVEYGEANTFGWEGPDPNTVWGGYQYRPLVELAETCLLDGADQDLVDLCASTADAFLYWLADGDNWPSGSANNGPPTDFKQTGPEINYPEPHMVALIMRAAMFMDQYRRPNGNADGDIQAIYGGPIDKAVELLEKLYIESGDMAGTFSSNPAEYEWYGFWHGEILSTLSQAVTWGSGPAEREDIATKARQWLKGMIRWAQSNIRLDDGDAQQAAYVWPFPHNWSSDLVEEFEFSTDIFESFTGREQRMSKRAKARRTLTLNHLLEGRESRNYQALMRTRQNLPILVPNWNRLSVVAQDVPVGSNEITLGWDIDEVFDWQALLAISDGSTVIQAEVLFTDGLTVTLTQALTRAIPAGARVAPATLAMFNAAQTARRHTSTVAEVEVEFPMLPQEDTRKLPAFESEVTFSVGNDTREVITLRPNWAQPPTTDDEWDTDIASYDDGPVVPVSSRDKGRRTIKARWTLYDPGEINAFLGLVDHLKGRRVACWLPSWTDDFQILRDIVAPREIRVTASDLLVSAILEDPETALAVWIDGTVFPARIEDYQVFNDEATITLDRDLPLSDGRIAMVRVGMISLMYRVRQASDVVTVNWKTAGGNQNQAAVMECDISFVTVIDEVS